MKGAVAYDSIRPNFPGCRRGSRFNHRGRREFLRQLKWGEKMNAGKVILGALTIIGLLADIIDDD